MITTIATKRKGPEVATPSPRVALRVLASTLSFSHMLPRLANFRRSPERWVHVLRLIQCVRDACRRVFCLCSGCDRGHMYCSFECRDQVRVRSRATSKRRHWTSFDGRWATARRVAKLRARRAQNVTDTGRQKLGQAASLSPADRDARHGGGAGRGSGDDR
jgi:hypothetical protein